MTDDARMTKERQEELAAEIEYVERIGSPIQHDDRVGCVAVYVGEKRDCLEPPGECLYFAIGEHGGGGNRIWSVPQASLTTALAVFTAVSKFPEVARALLAERERAEKAEAEVHALIAESEHDGVAKARIAMVEARIERDAAIKERDEARAEAAAVREVCEERIARWKMWASDGTPSVSARSVAAWACASELGGALAAARGEPK